MGGQCRIPALDGQLSYTQVAAGSDHTVLLRSDGSAVACGGNAKGQCDIPALDGQLSYTQVAAGHSHTVLLRSDGSAVACGANGSGECSIPGQSWLHRVTGMMNRFAPSKRLPMFPHGQSVLQLELIEEPGQDWIFVSRDFCGEEACR